MKIGVDRVNQVKRLVEFAGTSTWRATNSEECDVVWPSRYFYVAHLTSLLLKPWCTVMEQGDATWPAVVQRESPEAVKE